LHENAEVRDGQCVNIKTQRKIKACIPVHIFGHPVEIEKIVSICDSFNIPVIEDAAESLGSLVNDTHTGLFGRMGVFSFNGNKIVTSGGGGVIVTKDAELAKRAKHITTTAKAPHKWNFYHDELGFNYRMPNLNAALACAQLEQIDKFIANKRDTALIYQKHFSQKGIRFVIEPNNARSNYWLNAIFLKDRNERDSFLEATNSQKVMTRPVWELMPDLPVYKLCQTTNLDQARYIADRLVNIPSGVRIS
jgi:dTDP-4-amino-4,6-dideoxygalactose transaminase